MKAVIFDLDGTLTDTLSAISHFGNLALEENGFSPIDKDKYRYMVGDGRDVLIHRMLKYHNADTYENFEKVRKTYDTHYEADPLYATDAYDGIRDVLKTLKERGIKIAVCSNKPDNVVHDVINKIFGDNIFDYVSGVDGTMPVKPDPAPALAAMKALGAKACECIFTGDTNVDIFTAKNANMTAIGVLWGFRDYDELHNAGADHIIKKPIEYLDYI